LHGEILEDVEGSLWKMWMIRRLARLPQGDDEDMDPEYGDTQFWHKEPVSLVRVIVSVDPAGSANARSDETGIIVLGLGDDGNIYVLADYTDKYSPAGWAGRAVKAFEDWSADTIVAEKNYGGEMVRHTLETTGIRPADGVMPVVTDVVSRRGKAIRAEPMVGLYEKGKVYHIVGTMNGRTALDLVDLEDEMTTWIPGHGPSPNRVDALVHGLTELGKNIMPAEMAAPLDVLGDMRIPSLAGARRGNLVGLPGIAS
jgi:phage terminase large subunit-like protein